jgi:predicted GTPase
MASQSASNVPAAFRDLPRILSNIDQFKRRLAIGADAYATRRAVKSILSLKRTYAAAGAGASFAQSAAVAGAFFAPAASSNPLVWMGLMAPAAAVTPVGWVVAAALAAGGVCYGVSRWLESAPDGQVDVLPRFLNAPIDVLAMRLLDLNAALAYRLAVADGHVATSERRAIRAHFEAEWGYDPDYLDTALPMIERGASGATIDAVARAIVDFHATSQDCAGPAMQRELVAFLKRLAAADGVDASEERAAIAALEQAIAADGALSLERAARDLSQWGATMRDAATDVAQTAAGHIQAGVSKTIETGRRDLLQTEEAIRGVVDKEKLVAGVSDAGRALGDTIGSFAARVGAAARNALSPAPTRPEDRDYATARGAAAAEIGRINVLVAGNTGVGKSTLVNAIFGDAVAPTGAGLPVTQDVTLYEAPDVPLNLWDTRGFEAGDDVAVRAVDAKLAEMRQADEASGQIHVAWLCISAMSSRVEPIHRRFLADMAARGVPVIVVFTQSYRPMPDEARGQAIPAAAQIAVVAADEPAFDRKAFGLEALVEATDRVLPEARKTAFAAAQRVQSTLKKSAARRVVAGAAAAAAGTAIAPGHSAVLSVIQIGMLAKIDSIFGRAMLAGDTGAAKAMLGAGASRSGQWLFGTLLGDGLKASGIGYAAGVAIGGAVGGAITSAMGLAYIEGLSRLAESDAPVDVDKLAELVTVATRKAAPVATVA